MKNNPYKYYSYYLFLSTFYVLNKVDESYRQSWYIILTKIIYGFATGNNSFMVSPYHYTAVPLFSNITLVSDAERLVLVFFGHHLSKFLNYFV